MILDSADLTMIAFALRKTSRDFTTKVEKLARMNDPFAQAIAGAGVIRAQAYAELAAQIEDELSGGTPTQPVDSKGDFN